MACLSRPKNGHLRRSCHRTQHQTLLGQSVATHDEASSLYGVSYYSIEKNRSNRELFLMNADGSGTFSDAAAGQSESYRVVDRTGDDLADPYGHMALGAFSVAHVDWRIAVDSPRYYRSGLG